MNRTGKGNVGRSFAREGHKVHFRVLTPLGQRAAAGFMKHADALPDAAARVAAYRDAANYAGSGVIAHAPRVLVKRRLGSAGLGG